MKPQKNKIIMTIVLLVVLPLGPVVLTGCQVDTKRDEPVGHTNKPLVDPKYSLVKDRSELDLLRQAIPEDKKKANDENALFAEWTVGLKKSPAEVREKYENLVRKKRELFNKDMAKTRENFTKSTEQKRKEFLKDLEDQRKNFADQKKSRDDKNEFFNNLDEKRRNYFSEEREKRDEFESQVRDERKNFEDYLNEKRFDFASEMKAYTEKWNANQLDKQNKQ